MLINKYTTPFYKVVEWGRIEKWWQIFVSWFKKHEKLHVIMYVCVLPVMLSTGCWVESSYITIIIIQPTPPFISKIILPITCKQNYFKSFSCDRWSRLLKLNYCSKYKYETSWYKAGFFKSDIPIPSYAQG